MIFLIKRGIGMVFLMTVTFTHAQITTADNGLTATGTAPNKNVGLGGTLNDAQTAIDFGNTNTNSSFVLKKGVINYFSVGNTGTVTLGDATNPPNEHIINYLGNPTYTGVGIKLVNTYSGSIARLHSFLDGLYVTKNDGSPGPITAENFSNPSDGSTLRATLGRWEINSGIFTVNQWWTGAGQYEMTIGNAARRGMVIKSAASQTGNLMEWRDNNDNILSFMNSSGGMGIGTNGLVTKLTVRSTNNNDGIWISGPGTTNVALLNNTTIGSWNALSQVGDNLLLWKGSSIDNNDAGGLVLGPWSNTASGIRITPSGNVGIGVANPGTYKLAVEGIMGARKVKVTEAPWADFVFEKGYQLPSLTEVEKFITLNKHLPGIPTTKEVEKNGLDVGETQALLLQKIEELTLYIIQQQKEIEELKARLK